jgi:hypothetical protein
MSVQAQEGCLLRKQIAVALVASVLIGSVPGWADDASAAVKPTVEAAQRQQLRASIDRAVDGEVAAQALTAAERADLEARRAVLSTDPVARGGGGILLSLIATAASIGLTVYLLKKSKESLPAPSLGRP